MTVKGKQVNLLQVGGIISGPICVLLGWVWYASAAVTRLDAAEYEVRSVKAELVESIKELRLEQKENRKEHQAMMQKLGEIDGKLSPLSPKR